MRKEFEMSYEQLEEILKACLPVPYMIFGGHEPSTPQENATRAWESLGRELGFDHLSVKPVSGQGERFFTAEVAE